jgi:hypothetical protein
MGQLTADRNIGKRESAEMKENNKLSRLICFIIILSIAIPLWSAVVKASPAVEVQNRHDLDLYTMGENSGGVSLMGGWNLISLPIVPFDTDIADVLAAMARRDQLKSVWYFDQCENPAADLGEWHVYDATTGTGDLDTIEAGKAYWFLMLRPGDAGYDASAFPMSLWVFGTEAPMPPDLPSSYDVCKGWNMVGFRSVEDMAPEDYLEAFSPSEYGGIYGWDPYLQDWVTNPDKLVPGYGYWIPFSVAGAINP